MKLSEALNFFKIKISKTATPILNLKIIDAKYQKLGNFINSSDKIEDKSRPILLNKLKKSYKILNELCNNYGGEISFLELEKELEKEDNFDYEEQTKVSGTLLPTKEGSYQEQREEDPEKIFFTVRPSLILSLITLFLVVGGGYFIGWSIKTFLFEEFFMMSEFKWEKLFSFTEFAPMILLTLLFLQHLLFLFTAKYEISRTKIISSHFKGINIIDSLDMNKIEDVQLKDFGFWSEIVLMCPRDTTDPLFKMNYVSKSGGFDKKVIQFINAHGKSSLAEYRNAEYAARASRRRREREDNRRDIDFDAEEEN